MFHVSMIDTTSVLLGHNAVGGDVHHVERHSCSLYR